VSTESIASPSHPAADAAAAGDRAQAGDAATASVGAAASCPACGAPLAEDQRYCLQCGERRAPISSFLLGTLQGPARQEPPAVPSGTTAQPAGEGGWRSSTAAVLAGVCALLLAMGVGVLIGRSAGSGKAAAPAQVITAAAPTTTGAASTGAETPFTDNWPSGTSGYTVQLQTLPQSSSKVSAVESAKTAATAKGAKNVGALRSEDFSSLAAGNYVIYSGIYHKRSEAANALAAVKKSFPAASVIMVSNSRGASSALPPETSSGGSGVGQSYTHPAPPSVVESLHKTKGQSYEQRSKNLPNIVSTG
jgi:hypothetical protein